MALMVLYYLVYRFSLESNPNCQSWLSSLSPSLCNQRCSPGQRHRTYHFPPIHKRYNGQHEPRNKCKTFCRRPQSIHRTLHPDSIKNFQIHLNHIQNWATTWQMQISYEKSNIFSLTSNNPNQYFFENKLITQVESVTDLGILIEPKLKFNGHIHNIVAKAKQRAALIHRSFLSSRYEN